jgi:hypothetical protein
MSTMNYAYDMEFIEDGKTIDLISIGIVAEDGREYYAVNADMPIERIRKHEWLMENVVPSLPTLSVPDRHWDVLVPILNLSDPTVKPHSLIRDEVYSFLTYGGHDPKLWAFYGAYDHVAFAQLWGPMAGLPKPMPMRTSDIAQSLDEFDCWRDRPFQDPSTVHNALADARNVMETWKYVRSVARPLWILEEASKLTKEGYLENE